MFLTSLNSKSKTSHLKENKSMLLKLHFLRAFEMTHLIGASKYIRAIPLPSSSLLRQENKSGFGYKEASLNIYFADAVLHM